MPVLAKAERLISPIPQTPLPPSLCSSQFLAALVGPTTNCRLTFGLARQSLLPGTPYTFPSFPPSAVSPSRTSPFPLLFPQFLAALVGPATDWRLPFVLVAAPSLLAALLMLLTTREPPRGACEEAMQAHARAAFASSDDPLAASAVSPYSEKITWTKVRLLLKVPSNWLIFVQGLPGSLPWGMFISFFNDYIQIKNDFSPGLATLIVSLFGGF